MVGDGGPVDWRWCLTNRLADVGSAAAPPLHNGTARSHSTHVPQRSVRYCTCPTSWRVWQLSRLVPETRRTRRTDPKSRPNRDEGQISTNTHMRIRARPTRRRRLVAFRNTPHPQRTFVSATDLALPLCTLKIPTISHLLSRILRPRIDHPASPLCSPLPSAAGLARHGPRHVTPISPVPEPLSVFENNVPSAERAADPGPKGEDQKAQVHFWVTVRARVPRTDLGCR
jgi:hypothetical protein